MKKVHGEEGLGYEKEGNEVQLMLSKMAQVRKRKEALGGLQGAQLRGVMKGMQGEGPSWLLNYSYISLLSLVLQSQTHGGLGSEEKILAWSVRCTLWKPVEY